MTKKKSEQIKRLQREVAKMHKALFEAKDAMLRIAEEEVKDYPLAEKIVERLGSYVDVLADATTEVRNG